MFLLLFCTLTHWIVNPTSGVPRLPDAVPTDGERNGVMRVVVAKDEYEPGSVVLRSDADLGKVDVILSSFVSLTGTVLPRDAIDLKVVKVWYQNRNAWHSYFADVGGWKLCPELLLNDEELIRVDAANSANYARLVGEDGKISEKWINPPADMDVRAADNVFGFDSFFPMRSDFRDADSLRPIRLPKDVSKQLWLTVHATEDTPAGLYRGKVEIVGGGGERIGSIPIEVRVLDFVLPKPKTRSDPEKDMWIVFYNYISLDIIKGYNGGDEELAKRQYREILKDQVRHGQNMHKFRFGYNYGSILDPRHEAEGLFVIDAMREAGMITRPLVGCVRADHANFDAEKTAALAHDTAVRLDKLIGHHDVYLGYGDEPGISQVTNRYRFVQTIWQREGFKFFLAGKRYVFQKNAYLQDWHNVAEDPAGSDIARIWNAVGGDKRVAWYAVQHVGAENPALSRRQYGLAPWLGGFTALANYAHHLGPYNDSAGHYRPMVFAYGVYGGVLDTIQWEGFREGVDDMRYATLLSSLAREAERSADLEVRRLGMKALAYLAMLRPDGGDLDEIRMEMISYILKLKEVL